MMNIICNNCVGARIYQYTNTIYNNPFMWQYMDIQTFVDLINMYDKLDFNNVKLYNDDNNYYLVIDDKIKVNYIHYKKNTNNDEQLIVESKNEENRDIYISNIETYIIDKYFDRLNRTNSSPVFLIIDTDIDVNILKTINNFKYQIFFCTDKLVDIDNIQTLYLPLKELPRTGDKAKYILSHYDVFK